MEKIVKAGLRDCTVTLDGSECAVKFDSCYRVFAVRNDGATDAYISKTSGIIPDGDGVMCVKSGASAVFAHMDIYADTVYLLGTGKVQVHAQNDSANPFNFAPTFDGGVTAEGNSIQMDNLQGGVPFSEMVVSGKNLIPFPYNRTSGTYNGLTVDISDDGKFSVNGTATANTTIFEFAKQSNPIYLSGGVSYTINCSQPYNVDSFNIFFKIYHADGTFSGFTKYPASFTAKNGDYLVGSLWIKSGSVVNAENVEIQLELGTTPTAYEPPITGRELQVNVCGKNLLNNEQASVVSAGVTITKNSDGTVTLNGTSTADVWLLFTTKCPIVKDKTYTFSTGISFDDNMIFGIRSEDNTDSYMQTRTYGSFVSPITGFCRIRAYAATGTIFDNLIIRPQLEIGSTVTPYEPYNGSITTITLDSNPYTIPNDIRQQDGLNNISVSAGELTVTGVRKNAAIKKIWDEIDEIKTAIIVSNGESE